MSRKVTRFGGVSILCLVLLSYNFFFEFQTFYNHELVGGSLSRISKVVLDSVENDTSLYAERDDEDAVEMDENRDQSGADDQKGVVQKQVMDKQGEIDQVDQQGRAGVEHQGEHQIVLGAAQVGELEQQAQASDNSKQEELLIRKGEHGHKRPSKPLCEECLAIVQKAPPTDITFVDVSNGHAEHPHLGATDENGVFGFIHDETAWRRNPPPFTMAADELQHECSKRDDDYEMLTKRVFVDLEYDARAEEAAKSGTMKRPTIFCAVYTLESGHFKIPFIRETWGSKCDGVMVASNKTDVALGTVNIPHEGPEEYMNIWQKVRSIWAYIYDNYYTKYDWFHIGGDDLFLIVENLRLYLESEEIQTAGNGGIFLPDGQEERQTPLFLGRRFALEGNMDHIFNSGGAGYTMNKAALKLLVVNGLQESFQHEVIFAEDVLTARILRRFGVYPYETKDEEGGERYMPFVPGDHYRYRRDDSFWYSQYSINIKEGLEHCTPRSVAFHYVKGIAQKRLFALLYKKCPLENVVS